MATALRTHTRGVYCLEAAAELLTAQCWLQRPDFIGKSLSITPSLPGGQPSATVNWAAAITALDAGELPCSGGEQRMVRITASIGGGVPVDLQDSLTGIDKHNVQLFLRAVLHDPGGTYPRSVAAVWAVAFDQLAATDPDALELLTLLAWLGPDPVPLTLLTDNPDALPDTLAGTVADPLALTRCTTTLRRRGLATTTPHALQMHRVPAALLRARTRHADPPAGGWPAAVVRLLDAALSGDVWNNPGVWPMWQELLPHVLAATDLDRALDDVPDELWWLLDRAASYLHTRGQPRAALPLFERAYGAIRARVGDDARSTLAAANNLANSLRDLGEYQRARELDEDTLTRSRRVLGDDHPDTRRSVRDLATVLTALGDGERGAAMLAEFGLDP
jgi:hypothetical protein